MNKSPPNIESRPSIKGDLSPTDATNIRSDTDYVTDIALVQ